MALKIIYLRNAKFKNFTKRILKIQVVAHFRFFVTNSISHVTFDIATLLDDCATKCAEGGTVRQRGNAGLDKP